MPKQSVPQSQLWLSPLQAGERLGVSERLIRDWIAGGRLKAKRLGPRMLRVSVSDVDALLTDADN